MLKTGASVLLLLLSLNACANPSIDLIYADISFKIPAGFSVIGDAGNQQNILIFRYGDEPGQRFLAFSDMTNDKTVDYGCAAGVFFKAVFVDPETTECDQDTVNIMRESFVDQRRVEQWSSHPYYVAYSGAADKVYIFIIGTDGTLVKIDSDFLDKRSLREIVSGIAPNP